MIVHIGIVFCVAALQLVNSQVTVKNAGVCDNAMQRHGVGFNPHPYDCTQFVQCYYYPGGRVEPVYRNCEYGQFWDQSKLSCLPAHSVKCPHDKCSSPGVKFYKHSDPNKCGAFWECINGKAYGHCCPVGEAFHPTNGCVTMASCTDMCPSQDRVPGCGRRPISGAPTQFEQYTDNGEWKKEHCPAGAAYNAADCECSLKDLIVPGRVCKPDVVLNFDHHTTEDVSGNNYRVLAENVQLHQGAAYFHGKSRLTIEPLRPSKHDEDVVIVKMRFSEDAKLSANSQLQALVTNGHCGKAASVMVAKLGNVVLLGAEANMSRSFPLPVVNKPWKEIIYIHDKLKLEGRVCGARYNDWCLGKLKDTGCGFQFGTAEHMAGYVGLLDDISIYRCKPLDAVININY